MEDTLESAKIEWAIRAKGILSETIIAEPDGKTLSAHMPFGDQCVIHSANSAAVQHECDCLIEVHSSYRLTAVAGWSGNMITRKPTSNTFCHDGYAWR